jgi:hypothetical protein
VYWNTELAKQKAVLNTIKNMLGQFGELRSHRVNLDDIPGELSAIKEQLQESMQRQKCLIKDLEDLAS